MRENETRIGGLQWGLFSIFEPAEPRPGRCIDQSVVAWRLASKKTGSAAFENPRSVIQRTVNMVTGGSNRANERVRFNADLGAPAPYNPYLFPQPPSERMIPIIYRRSRMTAGEVWMQMQEENARRRYPTPEEVEQIQRRFGNPELNAAMEVARREYLAQMARMISEPVPPGYRFAGVDMAEEENLR